MFRPLVLPPLRLGLALAAALSIHAGPPPAAAAESLPDSTRLGRWTLANGLRVTTREIPGAAGVAITMAYRAGTAYDPPDRPELARLLAEMVFTGAAGDVPERTRAEMQDLRPLGWGTETNWRLTVFTEIATREQFPGVLAQVAARAAGVRVTDSLMRSALVSVRRDLGTQYAAELQPALANRVGALARGLSDEKTLDGLTGRALERMPLREVVQAMKARYVPANAVLSLAGDFGGVDARTLVERSFGAIPAGTAQGDAPPPRLAPTTRVSSWQGIDAPAGVVAVIAPPITDSLHAAFYLGTVMLGAGLTYTWGRTAALPSRYQYSLFSDPDLIRFYPGGARAESTGTLSQELAFQLEVLKSQVLPQEMVEQTRKSVDWLLGGPLPPDVVGRARREAGPLATLARNAAARALWMGDDFWAEYRRRFGETMLGPTMFGAMFVDRERQVVLLFAPRP